MGETSRDCTESSDDPIPNSMYSMVRLFNKKEMKCFDDNYRQSHLCIRHSLVAFSNTNCLVMMV